MKLCPLVFASTCFAMSGVANAGVIVVAAGGGGSFTDIQPAVNAAVNGDTILVKPGNYSGFAINGEELSIVGDVGTRPAISQPVTVSNLDPGQTVTLARLNISVTNSTGAALNVLHCDGAVRCVESDFVGSVGTSTHAPSYGVTLSNAVDIAFSGCTIAGGAGYSSFTCMFDPVGGGADGLNQFNGALALSECIVSGGHGGNGGDESGPGGDGVEITCGSSKPGFVFVGRSNVHGGPGGNSACFMAGCPSDGGGGLSLVQISGLAPIGWVLDSMVVGGPAGINNGIDTIGCPAAEPGGQYDAEQPFLFSASSLGLAIPAVAREGDFVTIAFTGVPGSRVSLNDQLTTTFDAVPSWRGVLLSPFPAGPAPIREIKWGVIPASGVLTRTYHVPQLPPGEHAQTRFLQAYRSGANGITLGSFRTLTVLDSSL